MEKYWPIFGIASALAASAPHGAIRQVDLGESQVVTIHTAVGFSTLIELPVKPTSVVLGDQDSFQVQYVGTAITIKPLVPRARSDLFIFTGFGRFNCELVAGASANADLLVKIAPAGRPQPKVAPIPIRHPLHRRATFHGFTVRLLSWTPIPVRADPAAMMKIEFELESTSQDYTLDPRALGIRQGESFVTIERLDVDSLLLSPNTGAIRGKITIRRSDLTPNLSMSLVFAVPGEAPGRSQSKKPRSSKTMLVHRITVPVGQPFEQERRKNPFASP